MNRLTNPRCSGIKEGYWSPAKKEELVQRLAHIRKKKEDKSHEKAKKPLPEAGPPHRGRRV